MAAQVTTATAGIRRGNEDAGTDSRAAGLLFFGVSAGFLMVRGGRTPNRSPSWNTTHANHKSLRDSRFPG